MDFRPLGAITEDAVAEGVPVDPTVEPSNLERRTTDHGGDYVSLKSLCMSCGEQGTTRLLLTTIPFFRDVILMSFDCEACGLKNSEVQSASVQARGCRFECRVETARDLNRQLVKGDKASFSIPELEFEIPSGTQSGVFTTLEGMISKAVDGLESTQVLRRAMDAPGADAVEGFLVRLRDVLSGQGYPFTAVLDDPTGNSFIENPVAPHADPKLKAHHYTRSLEQNEALGMFEGNRDGGGGGEDGEGVDERVPYPIGPALPVEGEAVDASELVGSSARAQHTNASEDARGAIVAYAAALARRVGGGNLSPAQVAARSKPSHAASTEHSASATAQHAKERAAAAAQIQAETEVYEALKARLAVGARDMSGNVPGGFKKGGALITGQTERASLTTSGAVVDAVTGAISANVFESSSSGAAKEVMAFPVPCHVCGASGECRMTVTDVPHFKEIILMAFDCSECGWRNVEVKGGGAVPPHGTVTELRYTPGQPWSADDMIRDVIKGDTAAVAIPEIELELDAGGLGGLYTTVEGLLTALRDKLVEGDPFGHAGAAGGGGDSSKHSSSGGGAEEGAMTLFLRRLDACVTGSASFTLRLRDPMSNTWVYSPYAGVLGNGEEDPRLSHLPYTRSAEEDEELGITDMWAPEDMECAG
jgi:ZPR1 zinc finger protein